MKRLFSFALMTLAVIGVFAIVPARSLAQGVTYAADLFGRDLQGQWGSADTGGAYVLKGSADSFAVHNSVGTIGVPKKNRGAFLAVSALNVNSSVRIRTDKMPEGGDQILWMHVRRADAGNSYVGRLRLLPDGSVRIQAGVQTAGHVHLLGSETTVPGVTYSPDQWVFLRMQAIGTNPTTLRLRSWVLGQTEPATWLVTVSDATGNLQAAGSVGLRVVATRKSTNRPFVYSFDDYKVNDSGLTPPPPPPPSVGSVYWGALVEAAAPSPGNLAPGGVFDTFEQRAQKKMSILHWGQPWVMNGQYLRFQSDYFTAVRNRGSIPFLDWSSFHLSGGVNQPDFQLSDIYNGTYDSYITQWAQDAKAWGHPFFLRFDWEMNGDWQFPWAEKLNGNQPGDYVKMWRHVHDIFKQQGATNVTWVWCPNIASAKTTPMASLYPGDGYVDWTCLDGYNKASTWLEFNQVFGADNIDWLHDSYAEITNLAPSKPLMIGETASLEAGDGGAKKAAWIKAAFAKFLPSRFPKIKGVLWFNWDDRNPAYSFPIQSSNAATQAFAEGIGSSYYAANDFANLEVSPIPPLP